MIDEPRALRILDALLVGAVALQVPVVVLLVGDPEAPTWQPWAFAAAVLLHQGDRTRQALHLSRLG